MPVRETIGNWQIHLHWKTLYQTGYEGAIKVGLKIFDKFETALVVVR